MDFTAFLFVRLYWLCAVVVELTYSAASMPWNDIKYPLKCHFEVFSSLIRKLYKSRGHVIHQHGRLVAIGTSYCTAKAMSAGEKIYCQNQSRCAHQSNSLLSLNHGTDCTGLTYSQRKPALNNHYRLIKQTCFNEKHRQGWCWHASIHYSMIPTVWRCMSHCFQAFYIWWNHSSSLRSE